MENKNIKDQTMQYIHTISKQIDSICFQATARFPNIITLNNEYTIDVHHCSIQHTHSIPIYYLQIKLACSKQVLTNRL